MALQIKFLGMNRRVAVFAVGIPLGLAWRWAALLGILFISKTSFPGLM